MIWRDQSQIRLLKNHRDGELLTKQDETKFEERNLKWGTTYTYEINSIDKEGIEGVNAKHLITTHPEVFAPDIDVNLKSMEFIFHGRH